MAGSKNFTASRPERGSYLAGGFIFSHGKFVTDVANDPQIFFAGEEIAMAVRAFTCGYDVYHPHQPLIWHYYKRAECPKVWQDHDNDARERGEVSHSWWQRDQRSKQRIATLLGLTDDNADTLAPYGPGKVRTLREFEYQTGLLFRLHATQAAVTDARKQAFLPISRFQNPLGWPPFQFAMINISYCRCLNCQYQRPLISLFRWGCMTKITCCSTVNGLIPLLPRRIALFHRHEYM